jgi:membrane fusion protein, multidrug efflux system
MNFSHSLSPWRRLAPVAVLAFGMVLAACGEAPPVQGQGGAGAGGFPPSPVTYVEVQPERVSVQRDFAGQLQGAREAEVRTRVGGILEARLYREGDRVEEGTPLFRVEREPYEIALQRAEAELANARAALNQAEREWQQVSGLFAQRVISERERDQALSNKELAEARLALAEAGMAQARLELSYTTVRAPIPGVTGLESLTEGNLVSAGTLLTTVTQLDPVQVRFAMPATVATARRVLQEQIGAEALAAGLVFPDGATYGLEGTVDFTASTVDAATGNVTLRAVFPNPDGLLKPGARARVRLVVEQLEDAMLVDAEAVSQGASGTIVYVVAEDNTARARPVTLGPLVDGRQMVRAGLAAGDRVIVNGQVAVRHGAPVQAQPRNARAE